MIRFLLNVVISLAGSLLALWVASILISGFNITFEGILIATALFTVLQAAIGPLVFSIARKYASAILGGIGLVSTLLALWITTLISDALTIDGLSAWISSTVVIWAITAFATWILGYLLITKWLSGREEDKKLSKLAQRKDS